MSLNTTISLLALISMPSVYDVFQIESANDFITFSNNVNSGGTYYGTVVLLADDIDFTDYSTQFNPIGNSINNVFRGIFDGQGHTISNLVMSSSSTQYTGLFGYLEGTAIQNVVIDSTCSFTNTYVSGDRDHYFGSIVGYCDSTDGPCTIQGNVNMANVTFKGETTEDISIGGIAGTIYTYTSSNVIKNCVNYGAVTHAGTCSGSSGKLGGIIGHSSGKMSSSIHNYIQNCANYGAISHNGATTIRNTVIGGIVGYSSYNYVENCVDSGLMSSVQESEYIGAIIGNIAGHSVINHCYWTGDVGNFGVYGYNSTEMSLANSSLVSLNQTTVDELNEYAATNYTWSKWLLVHLKGGNINNISQEHLAEIQGHFPDPVREGNSFLFWCKDTLCAEEFNPETGSVIGITDLYAGWMINTVTFNFDNGTTVNESFTYNEPIIYPDNSSIVKEGYTLYWDNYYELMPASDITITVRWEINNYTVTFNFGNGTIVSKNFTYNTEIEYPKGNVKDGYTFDGWDSRPELMPARNIVITAQWTETVESSTVEIVFGTKDLGKEEINNIIKLYTDDEFTIEGFEPDSETGETKVIIKFVEQGKAVDFVRTVNEDKGSGSPIKRVGIVSDSDFSPSNAIFTLFFSVLFFM